MPRLKGRLPVAHCQAHTPDARPPACSSSHPHPPPPTPIPRETLQFDADASAVRDREAAIRAKLVRSEAALARITDSLRERLAEAQGTWILPSFAVTALYVVAAAAALFLTWRMPATRARKRSYV